jgi:cytochrome b561
MTDQPIYAHVKHYNIVSISLHWIMFLLISMAFVLALMLDILPKAIKPYWTNLHFVLGCLVFALLALRLFWRIGAGVPELPPEMHPHSRKATHVVHGLLYVLMALIPIVGVLTAFYRGRGIDFGFYAVPSPFETDRATGRFFKEIHEFLSWRLFVLAGGHAVMALIHHYVLKDGLLLRMLPSKKG